MLLLVLGGNRLKDQEGFFLGHQEVIIGVPQVDEGNDDPFLGAGIPDPVRAEGAVDLPVMLVGGTTSSYTRDGPEGLGTGIFCGFYLGHIFTIERPRLWGT
jgi:hypothetical protein